MGRPSQKWLNKTLIESARAGDEGMVRQVLATGADIQARDGNNYTALGQAVQQMRFGVVSLLLDAGADHRKGQDLLNWESFPVEIALYMATGNRSEYDARMMLRHLWQHGVSMVQSNGSGFDSGYAVHFAASTNRPEMLQELLEYGASEGDFKGKPLATLALDVAIQLGHARCAEIMRAWQARAVLGVSLDVAMVARGRP